MTKAIVQKVKTGINSIEEAVILPCVWFRPFLASQFRINRNAAKGQPTAPLRTHRNHQVFSIKCYAGPSFIPNRIWIFKRLAKAIQNRFRKNPMVFLFFRGTEKIDQIPKNLHSSTWCLEASWNFFSLIRWKIFCIELEHLGKCWKFVQNSTYLLVLCEVLIHFLVEAAKSHFQSIGMKYREKILKSNSKKGKTK